VIMGDKKSVLTCSIGFLLPPPPLPPLLPPQPPNLVAYLELDVWVFFRSLVLSFPMLLPPPVY